MRKRTPATTFRFSELCRAILFELSEADDVTQTAAIENLLRKEANRRNVQIKEINDAENS